MKKYVVRDEDGKVIEVNEYEKGEAPETAAQPTPAPEKGQEPKAQDELFSEEQVAEIKRIVTEAITAALHPQEPAGAPTPTTEDEHGDPAAQPNPEEHPEDCNKTHDSVKSNPGAIPQKVKDSVVNDADDEAKEIEVNKRWEKRFD